MHATEKDLPVTAEMPGLFESRQAQWGGLTAAIEVVHGAHDFTKEFSELPTGRCEAPHWGYLLKGKVRILYKDHEEVLQTGDIYYMAPGHIPVTEEECHFIEFSAPEDYATTLTSLK